MCRYVITLQAPIFTHACCLFVGAFSELDESSECLTEVQSCLDAIVDPNLEGYDFEQECTEENEGSPKCIYLTCKETFQGQRDDACEVSDTLLIECFEAIPYDVNLITAEYTMLSIYAQRMMSPMPTKRLFLAKS